MYSRSSLQADPLVSEQLYLQLEVAGTFSISGVSAYMSFQCRQFQGLSVLVRKPMATAHAIFLIVLWLYYITSVF